MAFNSSCTLAVYTISKKHFEVFFQPIINYLCLVIQALLLVMSIIFWKMCFQANQVASRS